MVRGSFNYGEESYEYGVFFTTEKHDGISIHVYPDASVQVDAPLGEELTNIHRAILKRARWIKRHVDQARCQREHVLPRTYVSGESYFYLGRRYQLKVFDGGSSKARVKLLRGKICIETSSKERVVVKKHLSNWCRQRAAEIFQRRLNEIIERVVWLDGVPQWRMLVMQKQWGSCSPKGVILLNPHLVKAPRDCVDYVILHELCHLKEHNHSKRYYRLLNQLMPGWESVKAKLDGMAELLLNE